MSTIFPLSASVNQIFQGYRFNGEKWEIIGVDLVADYPEIVEGKISASVIPDTFATVDYVDQEISNIDLSSASAAAVSYLVDSAPEALNTLNELAAALGDDENFATTVTTSLSGKLDISSASTTYATKTELQEIDLLPSQTGNDGKYLSTDGSAAYWEVLDVPPSAVLQSASPVGAEAGQIWVDSSASASYLNTNDFLLKADVPYTPVYLMNVGASASRPSPAENGMFRFNTDSEYPEWYDESTSRWYNFNENKPILVDYLVVAGGGSGGQGNGGGAGGGGAGGYRTSAGTSGGGSSAESSLSLSLNTSYIVTVGAGGAAVNGTRGNVGNNSVFASVISNGGGGGGNQQSATSGGSGGGGGEVSGVLTGGSGTTGQGYAGGNGNATSGNSGAGGGGAGGAGGNSTSSVVGAGGIGLASSITGTSVYRGGGGGASGNSLPGSSGGLGGGGNGGAGSGGSGTVTSGQVNTGGGGGGTYTSGAGTATGGSGVVIIKIPDTRTATFSAGVTSSLSTAVAGYKVYTITATSTTNETVIFS